MERGRRVGAESGRGCVVGVSNRVFSRLLARFAQLAGCFEFRGMHV